MKRSAVVFFFFLLFFSSAVTPAQSKSSVWAVDYVKAKAGHYEDYLKFLEANWVKARAEARSQKFIVSYKLLVFPQDSKNEWDFMLMTEYTDRTTFEAREANFKKVFARIRGDKGPTLINGLGSRELADIVMSKEFSEVASSTRK